MMKKLPTLFLLFFLTVLTGYAQTRIISAATGNWNAATTWVGGVAPGVNDIAEIAAGHTVTINLLSPKTEVAGMEVSGTIAFSTGAYPLEINGDLVINTGGVFNAYRVATNFSKLVTIHGNLTNNGAFNAPYAIESSSSTADKNGGIVMGSATARTTIGGTGSFSVIRRLTIENPNGVTLDVPLKVSDILTLKDGVFFNGTNLTVDNTTVGTAPAGAATSSANCRILRSQSASLDAAFTISAGAGFFAGYVQNLSGANPNLPITEGFEIPRRTIAGLVMSHAPGVQINNDLTLTSAAPPLDLKFGAIKVLNNKTITCSNTAYAGVTGTTNSFIEGGLALTKSISEGPLTYPIGSKGINRRVLVTGLKAATGNVAVRFSVEEPNGGVNANPAFGLSERRWFGSVISGALASYTSIGITYSPDDLTNNTAQLARSATATGTYTNLGQGANTSAIIYSPSYVQPPPPPPATPNFTETDWKGVVWDPYDRDWKNQGTTNDATDLASAGVKWVRVWFKADYLPSEMDAIVTKCNTAGLKIIACYIKTNPEKDLGTTTQQTEQVNTLKSWVNRYKGSIKYWEIHNEANLHTLYWNLGGGTGMGSTDQATPYNVGVNKYVQWLQLAYNTIKTEDPSATVVLGGISSYQMEDFMDRLTVEQAYNYFDEVAYHPYADDPVKVIGALRRFQDKMKTWPAGKNNLPIWLTEIGFHVNTTSGGSAGVADEAAKAAYLKNMYIKMMQNLPHKRPVFWYILHEQQPGSNFFNLINRTSNTGATTYYAAYDTIKNMNNNWSFYQGQGTTIEQEFEYLSVAATSGKSVSNFYEVGFSNDNCSVYQSTETGDSVSYTIPNVLPGNYNVKLGIKRTSGRGTCQLYIYPQGNFAAGTDVGVPQDMYGAATSYETLDLGNVIVTVSGNQTLRFKVTGKNAASTGYNMVFDFIKLTPQ